MSRRKYIHATYFNIIDLQFKDNFIKYVELESGLYASANQYDFSLYAF